MLATRSMTRFTPGLRRAPLLVATAVAGVLAFAAPAVAQTAAKPHWLHQAQLPQTILPARYDIAVVPDAQRMTFTGIVSIALDVRLGSKLPIQCCRQLVR